MAFIGLIFFVAWVIMLTAWVVLLILAVVFRRAGRLAVLLKWLTGFWVLVAILVGFGTYSLVKNIVASTPRPIAQKDLAPFSDMYRADIQKYGFTPIGKTAHIKLVRSYGWGAREEGCDATLFIDERNVSRTVDFALENGKYRWTGEQEIHRSGRTFSTDEGDMPEQISITYSERERRDTRKGLHIAYDGKDRSLCLKPSLTLKDVSPFVREWDKRAYASRTRQIPRIHDRRP